MKGPTEPVFWTPKFSECGDMSPLLKRGHVRALQSNLLAVTIMVRRLSDRRDQSFKESFAPVSKHAMAGSGCSVVAGGDDQFAAMEVCESDLDSALGKAGRVGKHS